MLSDREKRLIEAQIRLKTANSEMLRSAGLLDRTDSRESHQRVIASIAANDLAQESVAKELTEPFVSSVPKRCEHTDSAVMAVGADPRCIQEEGHEGPHMYGELDPPPAA
jgi:hypothetical protein